MTKLPQLPDWIVGPAACHAAVTVLPLMPRAAPPARDYRNGHDALADRSLEICEGRGHVLAARNCGGRALLVAGEHLLGAHQNRMLTSSALVAARASVGLPVSCVEQGRANGASPRFDGAGPMASAALRRIALTTVTQSLVNGTGRGADQQAIWQQIATQQAKLRVRSATSSLAHTYAAQADRVGETAAALPYVANAVGLALGVGGELVSADVFGDAATCAAYWPRLVGGAALDALRPRRRGSVDAGELHALLEELYHASWLPLAAVGDGSELRALTARAAAAALFLDDRLVHFGLATRPALSSAAKEIMPYELPDELASRYRMVARLGYGAAKLVYRAVDLRTGAEVAIAHLPSVREDRFEDEVATLSRIASPYVPGVVESFVDERSDGYLVMEYCDGHNLAQLAPLPLADAAPIMVAFARALADIHREQVLHRDVKLENVMLTSRGLKMLDFGLSAHASSCSTAVGALTTEGTLAHMAREVIHGRDLDARADVYAFGISCFRLLVGSVPLPPASGEGEFEYMERLRLLERHDLSRLPPLPEPIALLIARMLDVDHERRPFMPEVVAAFELAFGGPPPDAPLRPARPPLAFERVREIAMFIDTPERLLVARCPHAPLVALVADRGGTLVHALAADGQNRWTALLDANLTAGVRADLDGDGVREIYLAGPRHLVGLSALGERRFCVRIDTAERPQLLAIPGGRRLVLDGHIVDPSTGRDLGTLANAYAGNGRELVRTDDLRGISFNGQALQAFRGDHATGAAIVYHPGQPGFLVAHLEELAHRRGVQLVIYGPGGARTHALPVADCALVTGDRAEISRIHARPQRPLFDARHAPLALLGPNRTAIAIVPLLGADRSLPNQLVAFDLPSGDERWRRPTPGVRAILGPRSIIVGTGDTVIAFDAWTGEPSDPLPCRGLPVALGDPFDSGHIHLITASPDGIELLRGPACAPGAMTWSGARGDLWRSGTLTAAGTPFGPL